MADRFMVHKERREAEGGGRDRFRGGRGGGGRNFSGGYSGFGGGGGGGRRRRDDVGVRMCFGIP